MDDSINDIFININNMHDYLLLIDIKVEKEFKLEDYKRRKFIELINKIMYYLGELEDFISNEYNIGVNEDE